MNYELGWLAYDHADRSFWIAAPPDCVDVVPDNYTLFTNPSFASVTVGRDPFGVAVDSRTGDVFVTNSGSNSVTVVNGSTLTPVVTIGVGVAPLGAAYDSATGEVYVANSESNNVSVINDTSLTVVATIPVGAEPFGLTADPTTHQVFVSNNGSGTVSAISDEGKLVVSTIPVGIGPEGLALDDRSGLVFVANSGSSNVSVIDAAGDFEQATIPVAGPGLVLRGMAYDSASDTVWVAAGWVYMIVLNATALAVSGYLTADPTGIAYDPDNDKVCATEAANSTYVCLRFVGQANTILFVENGLPAGTDWLVQMANGSERSTTSNISFGEIPWLYWFGGNPPYSLLYTVPGSHGYTATPASGSVSVPEWGTTTVNVTFSRDASLSEVEFQERGLPASTSWVVQLDDSSNRTSSALNSFWEPNGTYSYAISPRLAAGNEYNVSPRSGSVNVTGGSAIVTVAFSLVTPTLSSGFTYSTRWVGPCSGVDTNQVWLNGSAAGGLGPYTFLWTLPNGTATGARIETTMALSENTTVRLFVTDDAGSAVSSSDRLLLQAPPCNPGPTYSPPLPSYAIPVISVLVLVASVATVLVFSGIRWRSQRRG